MADNVNQPRPDDAVLGGLEGVKRRLASDVVGYRIEALEEALNYGKPGLNLVLQVLKDEFDPLAWVAYSLLKETAEKELKQTLIKSYETQFVDKRQAEEYVSYVSHEFRTPIYNIMSFLDTILTGWVDDPETEREFIQEAHNQAIRLHNITNDFLDTLRIEFAIFGSNRRPIELGEFMTKIQDKTRFDVQRKKLDFQINIPVECQNIEIYCDFNNLLKLFFILIDNALKYTPESSLNIGIKLV